MNQNPKIISVEKWAKMVCHKMGKKR
jgi:hypothetical protein